MSHRLIGKLLYTAVIFAVFCTAALAGEVLDDLLNYPVIDQKCPQATIKEEGMGLASQRRAKFIELSKEKPLGQTFRLGPKADKLWRVHVGICHWPDSWQEGEEVTFTLWDSPRKTTRLYSRTIDFAHKWFKWDVVFDTAVPAGPETEYYFELTHNGAADNKVNVAYIEGDDYERGQPYVAGEAKEGFDLYFVAVTKPKGNRVQNLKRLISRFDLSSPALSQAKWAYYRGDYDTACSEILKVFKARICSNVSVKNTGFQSMDQVCDEGRLYDKDHPGAWIEMSPATTWREVWPGTSEYVRMNDLFWNLGRAYRATGNEKYAAKLNELLLDYIQDNASPFEGGTRGGRWVAMFQAWRLGDAWDGVGLACGSKSLSDDVLLGWIEYWARMAKFAELEPSGGNHANAVGEALMQFGYRFPEYREAKHWGEFGFKKLVENSLDLFHEDGACKEPTMNYHGYSLANLLSGLEMAEKYGVQIPEDLLNRTEKALVYTAYMLKPNGTIPSNGDTNCEQFDPNAEVWDGWRKGEAMKAYKMFGRKDCLYIATAGREGTRPAQTSYYFPDMRYFIMRSDWGGENGKDFEQARHLLFRGGRYGSHGHDDLNQITLYAYGRPLIIDPGRTTYGTPLMYELSKNRSHNVLLVDDQQMNHVGPELNSWHASPAIDFVDNTYRNLYDGVAHRRAVVFVRPDYYVMFDRAASDKSHDFGINFWLTPPEVTIDKVSGSVHSNEPNGANILIKAVDPTGLEITERKGTLDLQQVRSDIPVVTLTRKAIPHAGFSTVLYPYPKGVEAPTLKTVSESYASSEACSIETPIGTDYVFYTTEPGKVELQKLAAIDGRAGLIRTDKNNKVISFGLIDGVHLSINTQVLASCDEPVEGLSVIYLQDKVEVTCPKVPASLKIAALGRTKAVVNGKEIVVSGDTFSVSQ